MEPSEIETTNLILKPKNIDETRAMIDAMDDAARAELSADWLASLQGVTETDPWILGFSLLSREENKSVGHAGFKGPPDSEGTVEIAYGVDPACQGRGYATETAQALVTLAFEDERVRIVRAHTRPEQNASTRVLTRCGFQKTGEVTDPEDGLVWRWERSRSDPFQTP